MFLETVKAIGEGIVFAAFCMTAWAVIFIIGGGQ